MQQIKGALTEHRTGKIKYWVWLFWPWRFFHDSRQVPGLEHNSKLLFLCRVRKVLEDRAMGDEERVMNVLFLFVFYSSLF